MKTIIPHSHLHNKSTYVIQLKCVQKVEDTLLSALENCDEVRVRGDKKVKDMITLNLHNLPT